MKRATSAGGGGSAKTGGSTKTGASAKAGGSAKAVASAKTGGSAKAGASTKSGASAKSKPAATALGPLKLKEPARGRRRPGESHLHLWLVFGVLVAVDVVLLVLLLVR